MTKTEAKNEVKSLQYCKMTHLVKFEFQTDFIVLFLTCLVDFNQMWDSGYPCVEPFEADPKNQILAKFGQNDGLIWPIFGQILKKKSNWIYFASENGIFKILQILKHLTEIWREAHFAKF